MNSNSLLPKQGILNVLKDGIVALSVAPRRIAVEICPPVVPTGVKPTFHEVEEAIAVSENKYGGQTKTIHTSGSKRATGDNTGYPGRLRTDL
jgi:hypothetical protein